MTTELRDASAKIYTFPARGRFASANREAPKVEARPQAAIGSGWYHEEAIRDADSTRKH